MGSPRHFVTFRDDFSPMVCVYFLKQKSEVFTKLKLLKAGEENETDIKIKYLRSDNRIEYGDLKFKKFSEEYDI